MTANQIAWLNQQETVRANQVKEEETKRSNLAKEQETMRSNKQKEMIETAKLYASSIDKLLPGSGAAVASAALTKQGQTLNTFGTFGSAKVKTEKDVGGGRSSTVLNEKKDIELNRIKRKRYGRIGR